MDRIRRSALFLPLIVALGSSSSALAQIELEVQLPTEDDPEEFEPANPDRVERFFNLSRCVCQSPFAVEFFIPDQMAVVDNRPIEVWIGDQCDDPELQAQNCGEQPEFSDRDALQNPQELRLGVHTLFDPIDEMCAVEETTQTVWALVDENDDGTYNITNTLDIFVDLDPPPALEDLEARGAEGGFVIEWELPSARSEDFESFQALCANLDGTPVLDDPDEPEYETPATVCNASVSVPGEDGGPGTPVTGIEALDPAYICGTEVIPANSLRVSDLPNNPDGYRVIFLAIDKAGNPNAVDFNVLVPQPVQDFWEDYKENGGTAEGGYCFVATATYGAYDHPHVVVLRDFRDEVLAKTAIGRWLIRTYYDLSPPIAALIGSSSVLRFAMRVVLAPIVAVAGLWVYSGVLGKLGLILALGLTIVLWRRRRRRRTEAKPVARKQARPSPRRRLAVAAAAGALLLIAFGGQASAQQEYLDELTEDTPPPELGGPGVVKWNVEFRFGPYFPDVDSEFSGDGEGPFEAMFGGGPMLMSKMAVERFFLYPKGQLGVSFGLGFLTTGADAYQLDQDGNLIIGEGGEPMRAKGERTNFRLFPTSVLGVYRFTGLDDEFNVPIVPYGKLGLAYTFWTITKPSGSVAETPTADCPEVEFCTGDLARGGSLGFEAVLGVAVRAERIDPDASVSLRNEMGIEHAGFFVEVGYSKVDGFGSDKRLSVGDLTYYGGFNFEF